MKTYEKRLETASAVCWGDPGSADDLAAVLNPDQLRVVGDVTQVAFDGGWRDLAEGDHVIARNGQAQVVLPADAFNAIWREVV